MNEKPSLDDFLVPPMTVREALVKCFNDDWNSRRKVHEAAGHETWTAGMSFSITVPMEMAKEVLASMPRIP